MIINILISGFVLYILSIYIGAIETKYFYISNEYGIQYIPNWGKKILLTPIIVTIIINIASFFGAYVIGNLIGALTFDWLAILFCCILFGIRFPLSSILGVKLVLNFEKKHPEIKKNAII